MQLSIQGDQFLINGKPTYRDFPGARPEALGRLMNSRMVQATFEDENPETVGFFRYPDGTPYDLDRQTSEFIAALGEYRRHGVIAVTVNFQGGYPRAHTHLSPDDLLQPWENTAYTPRGSLKWRYAMRMRQVIEAAAEAGMVTIVGLCYFGQNHRLENEAAVTRAVSEAVEFLTSLTRSPATADDRHGGPSGLAINRGNILVEINNECDVGYVHEILQPHRVHELIHLARKVSAGKLLVSTSYGGGSLPGDKVLEAADFVLLHGNGQQPEEIRRMVASTRARTSKPIVFNEDSTSIANLRAAWESGASWGYYDQGSGNYRDGFQSPPTNWAINTPQKQAFFTTVAELVGITP